MGACTGLVTLARSQTVILGARRVSLRAGEIRRVGVLLSRRERRALDPVTAGHAYLAMRDAQGLTRTITAPVRILRR